MKHLPKHLRPRWRYLALGLETWPDADIDRRAFQRRCWYAAQNLFGDPGGAEIDLQVLRFELADGWGQAVVRTRRGEVDRARAALACVDAVDGFEIGVRVRGVSGTVRACEEKYIHPGPESNVDRAVAFAGEKRRAVRRNGRVDVELDDAFAGATDLDI
jgi:ribonuclease P/MRP protein subunit POP5